MKKAWTSSYLLALQVPLEIDLENGLSSKNRYITFSMFKSVHIKVQPHYKGAKRKANNSLRFRFLSVQNQTTHQTLVGGEWFWLDLLFFMCDFFGKFFEIFKNQKFFRKSPKFVKTTLHYYYISHVSSFYKQKIQLLV